MNGASILRCEGLTKRYASNDPPALAGLDLVVPKNAVFGYLGPNGAGKTTTIKIMTGLMRPDAGTVWVGDHEVNRHSMELRRTIGYLGQEPRYYPWMRGRELLEFVGELFGLSPRERRTRAEELLELAGLSAAAKRRIGAYSGGMVQRIGIAQALVNRPAVLFLDEPVSSLDPIGRKEVLEFIDRLREETTVFMSTHILADVERVCDVVGVLNRGRMVVVENTATLKERFAPPRVELAFDTPEDAARFRSTAHERGWPVGEPIQGRTFRLAPRQFSASKAEILRVIGTEGLSLSRMETQSATLEEVFVQLVRDGESPSVESATTEAR